MITEELLTYKDISSLPKEGRYEVIKGRLMEMSPAGGWHAFAVAEISYLIRSKLRDKGYVFSGELGLVINKEPLTLRASDIAFYSKDRLREIPRGFIHEAPDLVVEVVAEETSMEYFEEKLKDYMDFGVSRIVFVDLLKRMVLSVNEERKISLLDFNSPVEIYPGVFINLGEVLEGV